MTMSAAMLAEAALHPALALLAGAFVIAATRGHVRGVFVVLAPALALWSIWQVPDGIARHVVFLGYELAPVSGGSLQRLFASAFAVTTLLGGLFAYRRATSFELSVAYACAAAAVGICFAGDLVTMFICLELMMLFSIGLVWAGSRRDAGAGAAGVRYALMLLLAGIVLKVGIEGVKSATGSIALQPLALGNIYTWMVLVGILIHAAAPPVSVWLADAYPKASPAGTLFLSMYATNIAVLLLIILFPGESVLIWIGLYMIGYGVVYGMMETDTRRLLCYALLCQSGFMICAIGVGSEPALNGAAAMAAAHVLYQSLLFMCAAAVIYGADRGDVGRFASAARNAPVVAICGSVGALALAALPLTAGFVTLPLVVAAAGEAQQSLLYLLLAGHTGVVTFAVCKLLGLRNAPATDATPIATPTWNMNAAMLVLAAACLLPGLAPHWLEPLLPYDVPYPAYTTQSVAIWLALPLSAAVLFLLVRPWLSRARPIPLDTDWLWRRLLFMSGSTIVDGLGSGRAALERKAVATLHQLHMLLHRQGREDGDFARPWAAGTMVLWVAVLLAGYVLVYYL
jgi:multicomponent Na+:H+ antiporter subunit D